MTTPFEPQSEPIAVFRSVSAKEGEYTPPVGIDHNVPLLPAERTKELFGQLSEAAKIENAFQSKAMRRLGYMYENGLGTEKNSKHAEELYRQAQILDESNVSSTEPA